MKFAKLRKLRPKRPKYSFAELLAQMPNVGKDEDFARCREEMRAWDEMPPVGREFGAPNQEIIFRRGRNRIRRKNQ